MALALAIAFARVLDSTIDFAFADTLSASNMFAWDFAETSDFANAFSDADELAFADAFAADCEELLAFEDTEAAA